MRETDIYLLISTLLLGVRHGIDWDHIAAILDLTGSGTIESDGTLVASRFNGRSLKLATFYALGHALIVVAFGVLIRGFASLLPPWFDTFTQQIVGFTLVFFGLLIIAAIIGSHLFESSPRFTSRAAVIASAVESAVRVFRKDKHSHADLSATPIANRAYPAFLVGVIHGMGAETSTQIMLIASVAAASSMGLVAALLASFTIGLIFSSSAIALAAALGFLGVASIRPLYTCLSVATSAFSVYVGICLLFGIHGLPALELSWININPQVMTASTGVCLH